MAYRYRLLLFLGIVLAFNYVDRLALGVVLQDIKQDLALTDTQLGLLTGIAFAIFYSVMGIPIARWADRGNRVKVISVTTGLWSLGLLLCGSVGTFLQLLLVRVGVAVGEAGCLPPAQSLISDYFTREERPRAIARYLLGGSFSVVLGYCAAGWLNQSYGWRITFEVLSLPGFVVAIAAPLVLKEPRFMDPESPLRPEIETPSVSGFGMREVAVQLWRNRTYRHVLLCIALTYFFGYGLQLWQPSFFIRSYGMKTADLGRWLAAVIAVGGLVGTYLGGEWAYRRAPHNEALQLKAIALCYCGFAVVSTATYLVPNRFIALALIGVSTAGINLGIGPLYAMIQSLVPERMRAVAMAVVLLVANLIGMGLGPLLAGVLSDGLRPELGQESLRWTLMALSPGYFWCAWHLWRASQSVRRDLYDPVPK